MRRDKATPKVFYAWVGQISVILKINTTQLHSYPAAKAEIREFAIVKHEFVKAKEPKSPRTM